MQESDTVLVEQYHAGNQDAAARLFQRYSNRLHMFAKSKTSPGLNSRVDPEDIVQSVFHSFFRRAQAGQYQVPEGEDLWKLLVVIALNKVRSNGLYHCAAKRDARFTVPIGAEELVKKNAGEVTEHALLKMTIAEMLNDLSEREAKVVTLRIDGYTVQEISESVKSSKRTVERILQSFQKELSLVCTA